MDSNAAVTILTILAAMARCVNENMAKVKLSPIDAALTGNLAATTTALSAPSTKV